MQNKVRCATDRARGHYRLELDPGLQPLHGCIRFGWAMANAASRRTGPVVLRQPDACGPWRGVR